MTTRARALMPDYLRLIALFGIVIVNVQFIAFSSLERLAESAGQTRLDEISLWLVNGLALLKTCGLFSFVFGPGLWDSVSRLTAVAIAVSVTIGLMLAVAIWRTRFALGPVEWVLRRITYGGQSTQQAAAHDKDR